MFTILGWIIYGLIVGLLAKLFHPGEEPAGFGSTLLIGVAGSFMGGFINYVLGKGTSPFSSSGIIMGVVGGVVCCFLYDLWLKRKNGS